MCNTCQLCHCGAGTLTGVEGVAEKAVQSAVHVLHPGMLSVKLVLLHPMVQVCQALLLVLTMEVVPMVVLVEDTLLHPHSDTRS